MGEIKLNIGLVLSGPPGQGPKFLFSIIYFQYLPYVFSWTSMASFELVGEQEQGLSSVKICDIPGTDVEEVVEDVDSAAAAGVV